MSPLVLFEMLVLLLIVAWAAREVVTTRRLLREAQARERVPGEERAAPEDTGPPRD